MTQALVLSFMMCWGPSDSQCSTMQKEVDSVDQCLSEIIFVRKDLAKMRQKGDGVYPVMFQFKCAYITGKE